MAYENPSYSVPNRIPLPGHGSIVWGVDLNTKEFRPLRFNNVGALNVDAGLLQFEDGTVAVVPRLFYKIWVGRAFSTSYIFEGVAADATATALFENPNDSGKDATIIAIEAVSFGQAHIRVYRNVTVTNAGTAMPTINLNMSSSNSAICNVYHTPTWSDGDLAHQTVLPGGARPRAVGDLAEIGESIVIPPGFDLIVQVTNKSSAETDISMRFVWWEE